MSEKPKTNDELIRANKELAGRIDRQAETIDRLESEKTNWFLATCICGGMLIAVIVLFIAVASEPDWVTQERDRYRKALNQLRTEAIDRGYGDFDTSWDGERATIEWKWKDDAKN